MQFMKDKKPNASPIAQPHFSSHSTGASARIQQASAEEGTQAEKASIERDKINRRYSFDDNGGGYLGL